MLSFVVFTTVALVVLLILLFMLLFVLLAQAISTHFDVPLVPTPYSILPALAEAFLIRDSDVVYDLGCGDGRVLFYCARHFPTATFIGIEQNPLLVWFIRVKSKLLRMQNISCRQENIFSADLSDATRIYTFLLPGIMNKIFFPGIALPHTRLISRGFPILNRTPLQTILFPDKLLNRPLYVYEF